MPSKFSKGFNIVEVIVAVSILSVSLVGIYVAFTRTISYFPYVRSRFEASYLAQEGAEIVRNVRDSNWIKGNSFKNDLTHCWVGCQIDYTMEKPEEYNDEFLKIDNDGLYNHEEGSDSIYKRKIIIEESEENFLVVEVTVSWELRGRSHEITIENHLYNWF